VAIEFNCPHCSKLLTTSDSRALALAKCPACDQLITVPAASSAGSAPSPELAATAAWSNAVTPGTSRSEPSSQSPPAANAIDASLPSQSFVPLQPLSNTTTQTRPEAPFAPRPQLHACPRCGNPTVAGAAYCAACGLPLIPAAHPLRYAGFLRRVVAEVVDLALIGIAAYALKFLLGDNGVFAAFLLWLFYNAGLESSPDQATFGKRIFGMTVCGSDGCRMTFMRAAIRTVAKIASAAICGVGLIMPLLTPKKQALHDLMVDAVIVLN
jgi:uncharacterized RDD family membrane protein YckC/phage FluMu protein Com